MKKRVLILPSWYPDSENPFNAIYIHEQAVAMSKQYEVAVLLVKPVGWRAILRGQASADSRASIVDGIPIYIERPFILVPRNLWLIYRAFVLGAQAGLKRLIGVWGSPDLLHVHVILPMGYAAAKAAEKYNIPVVVTEHSSVFLSQLKKKIQRRIVAEALQKADKVMAVSPSLAKKIQSLVPEIEPVVVGNLTRTDYFTPATNMTAPTDQKTRFLMVGFLVESKGIPILLNAAALLCGRGIADFEIIIGGDGALRADLEHQAERLHIKAHCRFAGLLDRAQVRNEMRNSDVFVLPSFHETFGIVLAEAMACGKPVISTRCGGPEYIVTPETGLLVEPGNSLELADAMEQFILGRVQFNAIAIRQSVVGRFGEDAFVSNVGSVYEQAMQHYRKGKAI
jgi:glycosyltransferase involved in cell wall biosynthesis